MTGRRVAHLDRMPHRWNASEGLALSGLPNGTYHRLISAALDEGLLRKTESHYEKVDRRIQNWIILADSHIPHHDRALDENLLKYIGDNPWDGWLHLGDLMDFDVVSHHTKTMIRKREGKRISEDYAQAQAYLDRHGEAVRAKNPEAKMVWIEGNHDHWIERYIDEYPALAGTLEIETMLGLRERGVEWVRYWSKGEIYSIGHLRAIHGCYTNRYHAQQHVSKYGTNVVYGHLHDFQMHSLVKHGDNETIAGWSIGCLCRYDQEYLGGRPTNWQQGFAVLRLQPNGFFNLFPVYAFDGRFIAPDGKPYGI